MSTIRTGEAPNRFGESLRQRLRQRGFWLTSDSLSVTEYAVNAGFDWILLDMEHTTLDLGRVEQHVLAARGGSAELVVRVPSLDATLVKRLLDNGVRSLMFPNVTSAEEARHAVAMTRYPPDGIRGYSGSHRLNGYGGGVADYLARYKDRQCILLQVESRSGVDAIPEMRSIDGVDGLFIGPNDLSLNLGEGGAYTPLVQSIVANALQQIRLGHTAAGILNFNAQQAHKLFNMGFDHIAVNGDMAVIANGIRIILQE